MNCHYFFGCVPFQAAIIPVKTGYPRVNKRRPPDA
jgi:hypothetical protein